jgi:hypothetical protein
MFHQILRRHGKQPESVPACRFCGISITRRGGFWSLWRAPGGDDPEYCGPSPSHAHKPL